MFRLLHLSDLHFPARDAAQAAALTQSIMRAEPALVVVTGDLTRAGRRSEFSAARLFLDDLAVPSLVVPGNHDVPVSNVAERLLHPFRRFGRYFTQGVMPVFANETTVVAGLNTARGLDPSADWSRGTVSAGNIRDLKLAFARAAQSPIRIVACHHPIAPNAFDLRRSKTRGSTRALQALALMQVRIVLHGHLHRTHVESIDFPQGRILQIGANTALSDRERGGGTSFNVIDIDHDALLLTPWQWNDGDYQPAAQGSISMWNL